MPLVAKAAYLWLCPDCKKHGRIICADGTVGRLFATKKKAYGEIERLSKDGKIDEYELKQLNQQVTVSGLVAENEAYEHWLERQLQPTLIVGIAQPVHFSFREEFGEGGSGEPPTVH